MLVPKLDQVKAVIWKNDQLIFLYIAVDRFLKRTLPLGWFLKHAISLDRFFNGGTETLFKYCSTIVDEVVDQNSKSA